MTEKKSVTATKKALTRFSKGESGNPRGRPKGSKNQITLLRQSLELQLRNQSLPRMEKVLAKALEMAEDGDRMMIKLLLELHMTKQQAEESKAQERVQINIASIAEPKIETTPIEVIDYAEERTV